MIIGIDSKPLCLSHAGGLKNYCINLILNLALIDKKNTYYLFSPRIINFNLPHNFINVVPGKFQSKLPWQIMLPLLHQNFKTDVFHFTQQHGAILLQADRIVTTVHDWAGSFAYPKLRDDWKYWLIFQYLRIIRTVLCSRTSIFIAVSKFSRNEIIKYLHTTKPIQVIYEGVNKNIFYAANKSQVKKEYYILSIADFSPRKNVKSVIRAYAQLSKNLKNKYKLKIIMSMSNQLPKLKELILQLKIEKNVQILLNISDLELAKEYQNASVFVYASLYEGFGLPILEAMACGCPVITSNRTATAEISGDCAYKINPGSSKEITQTIKLLLTNSGIRKQIIGKGLKKSEKFSWENTARETLKVYEEVFKS